MRAFKIVCALFASVVIMAAPAWAPETNERGQAVSESRAAET